jgi:formylglycine-generating enzyme required for sulfatase activity
MELHRIRHHLVGEPSDDLGFQDKHGKMWEWCWDSEVQGARALAAVGTSWPPIAQQVI